jgi:hypothetical protein
MEIVVQSLLQEACRLNSSIHLRYSAKPQDDLPKPDQTKDCEVPQPSSANNKQTSCIVIRRDYAYLEPIVRSTFQDAADVQVIADRRIMERRKSAVGNTTSDRRTNRDRRLSTPMMDILININGLPS